MIEKLKKISEEYQELTGKITQPEIINDRKLFLELTKKVAEIEPIHNLYLEYEKNEKSLQEANDLIENENEAELIEMAKEELQSLKEKKIKLEQDIKIALIPKDPFDGKNVIVEIRAGAGGDEAALFAAELMRMYLRYAEGKKWKSELISKNVNNIGGIKESVFALKGQGIYGEMKYESGVHRVQRVPETESQGRVHTSTATVAVLPEAEEVDIQIKDEDLRFDIFRSSGPGGQSVNTTDSAVRITHLPTGLIVTCQDEKSQLKNKQKAMSVLRSRLLMMEEEKKMKEEREKRLSQIGTGDRSEKIRTYNFPQDRVTDHRIKTNWSNIEGVMNGNLEDIISKLKSEDQAQKLMS